MSAIWQGNVTAPYSFETLTSSLSVTPSFLALSELMTTTDLRAVPARLSSPSCNEPLSNRFRQEVRIASSLDTFLLATGVTALTTFLAPSQLPI